MDIKLEIAVVAYNKKLSDRALRQIVRTDTGKNTKITGNSYTTSQGVRYSVIDDKCQLDGRKFDQLFIVDDSRWAVLCYQHELIHYIKSLLEASCVPDRYKIQWLLWEDIG